MSYTEKDIRGIDIILVEPRLAILKGHMRNNLELWCDALVKLGFQPIVYCYKRPASSIPNVKAFYPICIMWKCLGYLLFIRKYRELWVDFCTYLKAFRLSRKTGNPIIGLSAITPAPVAMAALFVSPSKEWGQVVMYAGLQKTFDGLIIRSKAQRAFKILLSKGCSIFTNTRLAAEILKKYLGKEQKVYSYLDPEYVPEINTVPHNELKEITVLMPGVDDTRRAPLMHLSQANFKTPIKRMTIHSSGNGRENITNKFSVPKYINHIDIVSEYLPMTSFSRLFSAHKFTLIAYNPDFFSGSANLVLSVAAGAPVLTSNFPFAEEIFSNYGSIGEKFEYGNISDFEDKWERLVSWDNNKWLEFEVARRKLIEDCNYLAVVHRLLDFTGIHS